MRRSILASSRRRPLTLPVRLILIAQTPPLGPIARDGNVRSHLILLILQPVKERLGAGGGNKRRGDVCHFLSLPNPYLRSHVISFSRRFHSQEAAAPRSKARSRHPQPRPIILPQKLQPQFCLILGLFFNSKKSTSRLVQSPFPLDSSSGFTT